MSGDESINGLAAQISELAGGFTKSLAEASVAEPNFTAASPTSYENLTGNMFLRRQELLDKITDLWYLVQGPSESIFNYVHTVSAAKHKTQSCPVKQVLSRLTPVRPRHHGAQPHEPL